MTKKKTFESSMAELEKIVKELESGNLSLEKAVSLFEQGKKVSDFCLKKLDETEAKITLLMTDDKGNITQELFSNE
ncbi:MAG: exodeoxyribonuclease VII small subunit [Desulfobacterium sp.]|jgi:exodeoxyribonuclease VII small subunit|nr:exodeoxyribonuclease VII small subunit [Desulfobacterium sp.]